MTRVGWRRIVAWAVLLIAIWLIGCWLLQWWAGRGPVQKVDATAAQLARGRYLTDAADCAACHTAPGGAPFAGGVPLASPFGTIHGTNITPDPDHGIGRYDADDFHHALTRGEARDGHQLYPAMPYVSYRPIAREDSDAIYAYLMNQPAVAQANRKNDVGFPFNIRSGIALWNLAFAGSGADAAPASQGSSPAWRRGRYLVDTLGHCGECHSPRGWAGQLKRAQPLAGNNELGRFAAPDITPQGLVARGWNAAQLRGYLATGLSAHAVASDEMLTVVNLSTSRLTSADLDAMTAYLLGDTTPKAKSVASTSKAGASESARLDYANLCAGCHGSDRQGVPHVAPGLRDNSSVRDSDPHNLIVAILDGFPEHDLPGLERMQAMPGFSQDLDDAEVAKLASWLRAQRGAAPVNADTVAKLRKDQRAH